MQVAGDQDCMERASQGSTPVRCSKASSTPPTRTSTICGTRTALDCSGLTLPVPRVPTAPQTQDPVSYRMPTQDRRCSAQVLQLLPVWPELPPQDPLSNHALQCPSHVSCVTAFATKDLLQPTQYHMGRKCSVTCVARRQALLLFQTTRRCGHHPVYEHCSKHTPDLRPRTAVVTVAVTTPPGGGGLWAP